jgi:thiol-disulfide isomerase/thioredoxin
MKFFICSLCLFISISIQAQKKDTISNQNAPDVIFQRCLDKNVSQNFYKGKILVIDFWATWCAPCIALFPHFNELSKKFSNNDVLFAAITDEPTEIAQKFFKRTKKQLNALILIDTTQKTKKAFNISTIPHIVVIDRNNVIRWSGDGGELTDTMLNRIIKNEQVPPIQGFPINKQIQLSATPKYKPLNERAFFSFDAAESDTGKFSLDSKLYRKMRYSDVFQLSSQNNPLVDIIELITGYSKLRFITNNDLKMKQHIDLDYKIGLDTSRFRNYVNSVFINSPIKNYAISLLGDAFKFKAKIISQKQKHYELIITDTSKLHSFMSMQSKHGGFSDDYFPRFEIVGFNLKGIATHLESSMKTIITTNIQDNNRYDLSLDISNIETLNKSLQFHGLKLIEVNDKVGLLEINFY